MKTCSKCKREFPATLEYFYKCQITKDGLQSWCRNCYGENSKKWHEKNNEYGKEYYKENREKFLKRNYGISLKEYNKMFIEQKGSCKICGRHQLEFKRNLDVDHDHKNGKIRGLLCINCNQLVGRAKENPFILIKAVKYLKKD